MLGVMLLPASLAYASSHDDTYIAGYAAGVLKLNLKLDTPTLTVKNGVVYLPVGSVASADEGKVVQMLSEIPGVTAVKIADASNKEFATTSDEEAARPTNDQNLSEKAQPYYPTVYYPKGIYLNLYLLIHGGHIFQSPIAITKAVILMAEI